MCVCVCVCVCTGAEVRVNKIPQYNSLLGLINVKWLRNWFHCVINKDTPVKKNIC